MASSNITITVNQTTTSADGSSTSTNATIEVPVGSTSPTSTCTNTTAIASTPMASCCPPNSVPFLASDYAAKGSKRALQGGTEVYVASPATETGKAIIYFSDVWGWDSGRTRAICDFLAEQGYKVYAPKVLQAPFEGGTDGDGLPPSFDMAARGAEFKDWITTVPWEGSVKDKAAEVMACIKAEGAQSIGAVGTCWGGWAVCQTSKMDAAIKAAVVPHPSIGVEGLYGGDAVALCKATQCPILLMPAGNDAADYDKGGNLFEALPEGTSTKRYSDMKHGWLPRGDTSNPDTLRDVQDAMKEMAAFFSSHL